MMKLVMRKLEMMRMMKLSRGCGNCHEDDEAVTRMMKLEMMKLGMMRMMKLPQGR